MVPGMHRPVLAALASAAALTLTTIALAPSAGAAPSPTGSQNRHVKVCDTAVAGSATCDAIRDDEVTSNGKVTPNATPAGYGPADIRSAYHLTASTGGTVAIVDAYDAPTAEADLATYRSTYKLPACTTANGCFTKMGQSGSKTSLPQANGGWAQEISLDLDMVSAACPGCKILLVEATSATNANLAAAVTTAAAQPGVVAISNSYGGSDTSGANYPAYANAAAKHIAVTASTGDSGYGAQSPATYPGVVAVGGTSLNRASNSRGWTETAWSGAGSGCSTLNAKPEYQGSATSCPGKADADVSAVADPSTGVAVYDSYAYQGAKGWLVFGGTSASSPIIAGVYAQAGAITGQAGALPWAQAGTSALNDVTSGSNGTCTTTVWCTSGAGWDGPTGLGTPNGTAAF
jgi:subtilase family serine protease